MSNIGTLENDIAEMFDKEKEADRKVAALEAELKGITEKKNYSLAQLEKVKADMQTALAAMQERERKLEELRKWWWVPFYNLYLGIRTLVDDDIGNFNSLRNTLRDKSIEMSKHQGDWQAANAMRVALLNDQRINRETSAGLVKMRSEAEADLVNLKKNAVFLTEAGIFWSRVTHLTKIKVMQPIDLAAQIGVLDTMLKMEEQDAPLFHSLQAKPFTDLYNSLAAFADTIDQGNNFVMGDNKNYCGGPPRSNVNVSSACQIDATRYYKIVNPVTCSFQYLNPPGCPPRPRETPVTEQTVAAGQARGTWSRAEGQNWVGRARCETGSIYYGTLNDQNSCERKCMSDSNCVTWTFNRANGMIGGTTGECWGGTKFLNPLKQDWGGFQSGGMTPPAFSANAPVRCGQVKRFSGHRLRLRK